MTEKEIRKLSTLAEVATMYYERHMTQAEIAQQMCISRPRISRLLQEAAEKGVIDIIINYNYERHYELERRITERFNIKHAYILNNRGRSRDEIIHGVANLGASALRDMLRPKMIVGVTWGNTVSNVVNALSVDTGIPIDVVQLMGSASRLNCLCSAQEIVSKLVEITSGTPHFLNIPLLLEDGYIREVLSKDANNAQVLKMNVFCDIVLTGIGTFESAANSISWLGYMNDSYAREIKEKGGIGCICGRFFDKNGKEIACQWNQNCVGITLEQLKQIDNVICVAYNSQKADSILAALTAKTISTLVTDGTTATTVLNLAR